MNLNRQLLVLALMCLLSEGLLGEPLPNMKFIRRSFKLDWRYQLDRNGKSFSAEVEEMHSFKQRRSILRFESENDPYPSIYYSDDKQLIKIDDATSRCHLVDHDYLKSIYYGVPENYFDKERLYMVGLGRLLALVSKHASSFEKKPSPDEYTKFEAQFSEISLAVYYMKGQPGDPEPQIPQLLTIKLTEPGNSLQYYNITWFQPLKSDFQATTSKAANADRYGIHDPDEIQFDLFSFRRAIGCSKMENSLSASTTKRLLEKNVGRFSFKTELREARLGMTGSGGWNKVPKATVVYDSAVQSLRVHQAKGSDYSRSIYEFKFNRRYHVIGQSSLDQPDVRQPTRLDVPERSSCVVTRIVSGEQGFDWPFSVGRLLLGTERLHYLGLARVRGIEARVYQMEGSKWPIWLQPPMLYLDADKKLLWRDDVEVMKKAGVSMTNIFYFATDDELQDEEIFGLRLLLVEIIIGNGELHGQDRSVRYSFPVYDFLWGLPNLNPDGDRYENSFSLEDDCISPVEDDKYASIEMELEVSADNHQDLDWLRHRASRNIAMLALSSMNRYFNPISMIHDVNSRVVSRSELSTKVAVVIRAAERITALTETRFICKLDPTPDYFDAYKTINLDACYMMVAHERKHHLLAYDGETCYKLSPGLAERWDEYTTKLCDSPHSAGRAELYEIIHHTPPDRYSMADRLIPYIPSEANKKLIYESFLSNPYQSLPTQLKVKIRVAAAHVKDNKLRYKVDNVSVTDIHKFVGFGLVSSDHWNKQVDPKEQAISFETCETACLVDLECRSFSVCTSGGQMRCTLSTINFSTPSMVLQLIGLIDKKSKLNEKFLLNVDPVEQSIKASTMESIQVIKHPNCELHNKLYFNYFHSMKERMMYTGIEPIFRPVIGIEQCAEMCFNKSIESLQIISQSESVSRDSSRYELAMANFCYNIAFVSKQAFERDLEDSYSKDLTAEFKEISEKLKGLGEFSDEINGFCVLENHKEKHNLGKDEIHVSHEALKQVWFTIYRFKYELLYEKKAGVSLSLSYQNYHERQDYINKIKEAVERGQSIEGNLENLGSVMDTYSARACAGECFSYGRDHSFRCLSFDYFEIDNPTTYTRKRCAFNSITLESALASRTDLIKYDNEQTRILLNQSDVVRVWHYEPRAGLFSRSMEKMYHIYSARDVFESQNTRRVSGPMLAFSVIAFLVSGMVLGVVLGIKHIRVKRPEEVDALVESGLDEAGQPRVELENIDAM